MRYVLQDSACEVRAVRACVQMGGAKNQHAVMKEGASTTLHTLIVNRQALPKT